MFGIYKLCSSQHQTVDYTAKSYAYWHTVLKTIHAYLPVVNTLEHSQNMSRPRCRMFKVNERPERIMIRIQQITHPKKRWIQQNFPHASWIWSCLKGGNGNVSSTKAYTYTTVFCRVEEPRSHVHMFSVCSLRAQKFRRKVQQRHVYVFQTPRTILGSLPSKCTNEMRCIYAIFNLTRVDTSIAHNPCNMYIVALRADESAQTGGNI